MNLVMFIQKQQVVLPSDTYAITLTHGQKLKQVNTHFTHPGRAPLYRSQICMTHGKKIRLILFLLLLC